MVQQSPSVTALQGYDAVGTGAHAPGALLATAASLFPDPLQTANSEMLLNTADPLSSINSTINILDTFEERERQARSSGCIPLTCFHVCDSMR